MPAHPSRCLAAVMSPRTRQDSAWDVVRPQGALYRPLVARTTNFITAQAAYSSGCDIFHSDCAL